MGNPVVIGVGATTLALTNAAVVPPFPIGYVPVAGDLIMCVTSARTLAGSIASTYTTYVDVSSNNFKVKISYIIAVGVTDTPPTVQASGFTGSQKLMHNIVVVRGVNQSTPFGVSGTFQQNTTNVNIGPIPAITPTNIDSAIFVLGNYLGTWTSVATLSGDGLTWSEQIDASDATVGGALAVGLDMGAWAGAAPTITNKTFVTTGGSSVVGAGFMFEVIADLLKPETSALTIQGNVPLLEKAVLPETGILAIQGNVPLIGKTLIPNSGTVTVGGNVPLIGKTLLPSAGNVTIGGNAPSIAGPGTTIAPTAGNITLGGNVPAVAFGMGTFSNNSSNNAAITLPIPSDACIGDIGVICAFYSAPAGSLLTPAGWTRISLIVNADSSHYIFTRPLALGDGAPTVTPTGGSAGDGLSATYLTFHGAGPITDLGMPGSNPSQEDIPVPAVQPTKTIGAVVVFGGRNAGFTSAYTLSGDGLTWVKDVDSSEGSLGFYVGIQHALFSTLPTITDKIIDVSGGAATSLSRMFVVPSLRASAVTPPASRIEVWDEVRRRKITPYVDPIADYFDNLPDDLTDSSFPAPKAQVVRAAPVSDDRVNPLPAGPVITAEEVRRQVAEDAATREAEAAAQKQTRIVLALATPPATLASKPAAPKVDYLPGVSIPAKPSTARLAFATPAPQRPVEPRSRAPAPVRRYRWQR